MSNQKFYQLKVQLVDNRVLELVGYEDTLNHLAHIANETGRFSKEDVFKVFPLKKLNNCQLITHNRKLMIWGAGRAGTTFLIRLLTRLGFFTGYIPYKEGALTESGGGCEFGIQGVGNPEISVQEVCRRFQQSPFVLKVLLHAYYAKLVVFHYRIPIGHIVIPVRDHGEVARSRLARSELGENLLWGFMPATEDQQTLAADIVLGKTVETAVLADIPLTFMRFPDIVKDEEYCWDKINPMLVKSFDIHLDRAQFREEFNQLSDLSISSNPKENQNSAFQRRN